MQWAVAEYKKQGGEFSGRKSPSNKLARWSRQKWRTYDGSLSKGLTRYLPENAWKDLTLDQIRRTNRAKCIGHSHGKQYVRQPKDVAAAAKPHRAAF